MNRLLLHIAPILFYCALILTAQSALAQHCKFYELSYKDSLVTEDGSNLLINNIKISNPGHKTTRLAIRITIPKNWKNVSSNKHTEGELYYNLAPQQSKVIPLNLLKLPKAPAKWDSVIITVRLTEFPDTDRHYCLISAGTNAQFECEPVSEDVMLSARPDGPIPLTISIRNTGNVEDAFTVKYESYEAGLNQRSTFRLKPGEDTSYTYNYRISALKWQEFQEQSIGVTVSSEKGSNTFTHGFRISKKMRYVKKQKYPYEFVPIMVETGVLNFGNTTTYYIGANGDIRFDKKNDLFFNYRSRQLGNEVYGMQRDIFSATFTHDKWAFSAGQISSPQQFFMSNGRGGSIAYKPRNGTEFIIAANLKDSNFFYNSNTFAAGATYTIAKLPVKQAIAADFNDKTSTDAFAWSNMVTLVARENMQLSASGGAGYEKNHSGLPGTRANAVGLMGGYTFSWRTKKWTATSNVTYFSRDMPGTQKGSFLQMHQLVKNFGKSWYAGVNYSLNHIETRYFVDTLYNTDILRNNSERYGITTGFINSRQRFGINFGYLKSSEINNSSQNAPVFFDISYGHVVDAHTYVGLTMQNAFVKAPAPNEETMFSTTLSGSMTYRFLGANVSYTRSPAFTDEKGNAKNNYQTTISGGPYLNFRLLNKKLTGSLRYMIAKSVYDTIPRQIVSATASYQPRRYGWSISGSFNMPLNNATISGTRTPISESKSFSISIIKHLNIPIITKRKYVTMKNVAYFDANSNDKRDAGEVPLSNVRLEVSELDTSKHDDDDFDPIRSSDAIYTNKKGEARYMNAKRGLYTVGVGEAEGDGLIPAGGAEQTVVLKQNMVLEIPFKKARSISGKITIIYDQLSKAKMSPDYIKVVCMDSMGRKRTTVTNRNGEFTFNLAAGKYTVSLNPAAFSKSEYKPDEYEYEVDLTNSNEQKVEFTVRQKQRKIRYMDTK